MKGNYFSINSDCTYNPLISNILPQPSVSAAIFKSLIGVS